MRVGDARRPRRRRARATRPRIGDNVGVALDPDAGAPVRRRDRAGGALMAGVRLEGVPPATARRSALSEVSLDVARRRVHGRPRAARRRQDDARCAPSSGLETPTAGDVFIDDERVNDVLARRSRHLDRVPEPRALPRQDRPRQPGVPAEAAQGAEGRARRAHPPRPPSCCASSRCSSASRASCPAASASAWRSAARSCATRASTSSTSRSRPSTPCCGSRCAPSSSTCSATSAARSCTSRTTRSRR